MSTDLKPENGEGLAHDRTADEDDPMGSPPGEAAGSMGGSDVNEENVEQVPMPGDSPPTEAPAAAVHDSGPPPITPQSSPLQRRDRAAYEDLVNGQLERWIEQHRDEIRDTMLSGGTVELSHSKPDDSDSDIAPETALAFAADEGLTPYSEWDKDDLKEECRKRELPVSGTKDELIARLEESDAEDAKTDD